MSSASCKLTNKNILPISHNMAHQAKPSDSKRRLESNHKYFLRALISILRSGWIMGPMETRRLIVMLARARARRNASACWAEDNAYVLVRGRQLNCKILDSQNEGLYIFRGHMLETTGPISMSKHSNWISDYVDDLNFIITKRDQLRGKKCYFENVWNSFVTVYTRI